MKHRSTALPAALLALALSAGAVTPQFWENFTAAELLRGTLTRVSLSADGKVFMVDKSGNGSLFFHSKELDIFALALDANDALYVGSSPDGKIYKVTGP